MNLKIRICTIFFACIIASALQGTEVLVWDNDQDGMFFSQESYSYVHCETRLVQALQDEGLNTTVVTDLPGDLSSWDVIFVVLGFACPG